GSIPPVLLDITNGKRYSAQSMTPPFKFRLEGSATNRELVLVNMGDDNIKTVNSGFEPRNFINFALPENQGDYLIISNRIFTDAGSGVDPIEDYREYRSSTAGGGFQAKVYLIDQLEDQFIFGIT